MKDSQRSRLYKWERTALRQLSPAVLDAPLDLQQTEHLLDRIARHYKVKQSPNLSFRRQRRATWNAGAYRITLPGWARRTDVVLHEAAHWIHDTVFLSRGPYYGAHGRMFLAIFLYLLHRFAGLPLGDLTRTAREAGLDFASADAHRPPRPKRC